MDQDTSEVLYVFRDRRDLQEIRLKKIKHKRTVLPEVLFYVPRKQRRKLLYCCSFSFRHYLVTNFKLLNRKSPLIRAIESERWFVKSKVDFSPSVFPVGQVIEDTKNKRLLVTGGASWELYSVSKDLTQVYETVKFDAQINCMLQVYDKFLLCGFRNLIIALDITTLHTVR